MSAELELTEGEHDMLIEVATIGASRAAGSMAKIINHRVEIIVPELSLTDIELVPALMGEPEQTMTVVIVKIEGQAEGTILLLLSPGNAAQLVADIAPGQQESALEEVANIFSGTSLGALSRFLKLKLRQSIPGSATDMLRAIINEVISEFGTQANKVLLLSIGFKVADLQVDGRLYFIFNSASTQKILQICEHQISSSNNASS